MKAHGFPQPPAVGFFSRNCIRAEKRRRLEGVPGRSRQLSLFPVEANQPSNVDKLEVAWSYPATDGVYFFCPLVVDNIAYVAAKQGALVALDATTGKELWVHSFPAAAGRGGGRGGGIAGQRGANYWESKDRSDRRIFVTTGGYLHAIDALTGKTVDSFADHGKLDLKIGIDRAPIPLASRTPGRIFENLIILGSVTGEGYLAPPGDIRRIRRANRQTGVGVSHHSAARANSGTTRGRRTPTSTWAASMCGVRSRSTRSAGSCIFRPRLPNTSYMAAIAPATISSPIACWRSTRARGNICGISRPCITISGTTIRRPRRNWRP